MTSGDLAELEQANKGTFLVCFHRGEVEFSTSKVARTYETVDGSVDVVEVERGVRSEVAGLHAHENALVVSVVCAELEGTARRVFEGSSFHVESKEIVPLHFSVGSAGVRVCSPLTEAHLERLRLVLQSAIAEQEPVPVAELFLEAMQEQHGLVPFFLAWTATERLVHYVFRRRGLTAEAEPVRPQVPLNARAKKVVEAIVPAGDRDRVLATFKGLKKNRDDLFHRGGRTSDHYPTDEACQFLSEVLRCHLGCDPPSTPKCSN
jgi:hypothetical protein